MTFILKLYTIVFGLMLSNLLLIAQNKSIELKKDKPTTSQNNLNASLDSSYLLIDRGSLLDTTFLFSGLESPLKIWVHLPKNYTKNKKAYPVIYLPDTNNAFNENRESSQWKINNMLDSLELAGKRTAIVVGIDAGFEEQHKRFVNEADSLGLCKRYINFLADSLKPFIDAHYRTLKDRKNTLIAGSSFAANLSYFAFLNRNERFGKAGLFSPEFKAMPLLNNFTDSLAKDVAGKLFYYCGGFEDEESQKKGEAIVLSLGEKSKAVIYSLADSECFGNPTSWSNHFSAFIIWALADGNNSILNIKN